MLLLGGGARAKAPGQTFDCGAAAVGLSQRSGLCLALERCKAHRAIDLIADHLQGERARVQPVGHDALQPSRAGPAARAIRAIAV